VFDVSASEFAAAHHVLTCVAAMIELQAQVSDPTTYANDLSVPETAWATVGGTGAQAASTGALTSELRAVDGANESTFVRDTR
jgi:hypothetical protein